MDIFNHNGIKQIQYFVDNLDLLPRKSLENLCV